MKAIHCIIVGFLLSACSARNYASGRSVGALLDYDVRASAPKKLQAFHPEASEKPDTVNVGEVSLITLDQLTRFKVHSAPINALVVTDNGQDVYTGSDDGSVVRTRMRPDGKGSSAETIFSGPRPVLALALSPNGKQLAIARFSVVFVLDLATHEVVSTQTTLEGRITALSWDPRGEYLAIGRSNGDVYLWSIGNSDSVSADRLESYRGSSTPIESIMFHPAGGVIFVAERGGKITVWRLIRTERESGMRDDAALIDRDLAGKKKVILDVIKARVEDIWLNQDGTRLFAAAADGQLYRVKVRGLLQQTSLLVSNVNLSGVSGAGPGVVEKLTGDRSIDLLAASGREARLQFWCANGESKAAIASSALLREPLSKIRLAANAPVLWGVQKTGNLMRFDLSALTRLPTWKRSLKQCRDQGAAGE